MIYYEDWKYKKGYDVQSIGLNQLSVAYLFQCACDFIIYSSKQILRIMYVQVEYRILLAKKKMNIE